jgi:prephenate dehydratase
LRLVLNHKPAVLAKALNLIGLKKLNLSKIQSVPIIGKPYEYAIHLDVLFNSQDNFNQVIEELKPLCINLKVLGIYQQGNKPVLK